MSGADTKGLVLRVLHPDFQSAEVRAGWVEGVKAALGDIDAHLGLDGDEVEQRCRFADRERAIDIWISAADGQRRAEQYAATVVGAAANAVLIRNQQLDEDGDALSDDAMAMHGFAVKRDVSLDDFEATLAPEPASREPEGDTEAEAHADA